MKTTVNAVQASVNDGSILYIEAVNNPGIYQYLGSNNYLIVPEFRDVYKLPIGVCMSDGSVFDPRNNGPSFRFTKISGKKIVLTFES